MSSVPHVIYNPFTNNLDYTGTGGGGGGGNVVGPSSAVNNNVVLFDGVTGKLIKDSGVAISTLTAKVSGPSSSTDSHIVIFDGVTGKLIKDSGFALSALSTLVTGPASSTDNDIAVFDGTTGLLLKDTGLSSTDPTFTGIVTAQVKFIAPYDTGAGEGYYFSDGTVAARQAGSFQANYFFGNSGNSTMTGAQNTGCGHGSLNALTSGSQNTAMGQSAMISMQTGGNNVAIGGSAMQNATDGSSNVAIGVAALASSSGYNNCIAIGQQALQSAGAGSDESVAIGSSTLISLTSGFGNVAIGHNCLTQLLTGAYNVVLGDTSGSAYSGSETGNILISNVGVAGENGVIRIGNDGFNECYIAGIAGQNVSNPNTVIINNASGKLGEMTGAPQVVLKSDPIDMTVVGPIALFFTTGDFVITGINAYAETITGTPSLPIVNLGWTDPAYSDFVNGFSNFSSTQGNYYSTPIGASIVDVPFVPISTAFYVNITTADVTATANMQRFDITGYYL